MGEENRPVVTNAAERPREGWGDPARGSATWFTFFSGDITPTSDMSAGVVEIPGDGGSLRPHRHEQPEIYFIVDGTGLLTIDGTETIVSSGSAAFIPSNALHGLRNESGSVLRVFYVFPTDRFSDIVYRFPEG